MTKPFHLVYHFLSSSIITELSHLQTICRLLCRRTRSTWCKREITRLHVREVGQRAFVENVKSVSWEKTNKICVIQKRFGRQS